MSIKNALHKNSPSILLAFGIGGFIGAVAYTARIAPKAEHILDDLPPEASKIDKIKAIGPTYAPILGLVLASTGAILASNRMMRDRYAALLVLYSFTDQVAQRWKSSAEEELTNKAFHRVKEKVVGADEPIPKELADKEDTNIFFDAYSKRWFTAGSIEYVRKAINDINQSVYSDDYAPLNDFYYAVGLEDIEYGEHVGWHVSSGAVDIDLTPIIRDDWGEERAYISVSFSIKPRDYQLPDPPV